jgi:non-heme chloroperoxidase
MPYATTEDGAELYYEEYRPQGNEAELLVLVHGSLGDFRDWANQIRYFQNSGFRVVTYSRRNHYPNAWKNYPGNYSLSTEKDDIVSLLRELGGNQASLIGHSYGGFAVALMARDYPEYVRKLVLIEPPILTILGNDPAEKESIALERKFARDTIEPAREFLQKGEFESALSVFLDGISGIRGLYHRLKAPLRTIMLDNARTALPEIEITPERDPFGCLDAKRIHSSTLLVKGEWSPKILQFVTDELSKCIPKSKVVTIQKSSHGVIWDNPQLFNESVLRFLKEIQ